MYLTLHLELLCALVIIAFHLMDRVQKRALKTHTQSDIFTHSHHAIIIIQVIVVYHCELMCSIYAVAADQPFGGSRCVCYSPLLYICHTV